MQISEKLLMSIPEVAEVTGLGESSIWRLIWRKELTSVRIGRSVRVRREDLEKFIEDHLVAA